MKRMIARCWTRVQSLGTRLLISTVAGAALAIGPGSYTIELRLNQLLTPWTTVQAQATQSQGALDLPTYRAMVDALANFLGDRGVPFDEQQVFQSVFTDLNGDKVDDALLLLQGPGWCGSGGCTLLVLRGQGDRFELQSQSTLIQKPLMISETQTAGWRDLIVQTGGGGYPTQTVVLRFDGQAYPANPTTDAPPAADNPNGAIVWADNSAPRAAFDLPDTEAACLQTAADRWQLPVDRLFAQFTRADQGRAVYAVASRNGLARQGFCRVRLEGLVESFTP